METKDKITEQKLKSYFEISEKALETIRSSVVKGREKEAKEIIEMAHCYISDAKFFREKKDFVNCLASLSYAYGWIDCGARLGIFSVKDRKMFTV